MTGLTWSMEVRRLRFALCWIRSAVGLTLGLAMFPGTLRVFESLSESIKPSAFRAYEAAASGGTHSPTLTREELDGMGAGHVTWQQRTDDNLRVFTAGDILWTYRGATALEWSTYLFLFGICLELLLEVPTGALADWMGRKFANVSCWLARAGTFLCLAVLAAPHLQSGYSPEIVIGIAAVWKVLFAVYYTLLSGSVDAWVRDSLDKVGGRRDMPLLLAHAEQWYWGCYLLGSVVGIALAKLTWMGAHAGPHATPSEFLLYLIGVGLSLTSGVVVLSVMREDIKRPNLAPYMAASAPRLLPGFWAILSRGGQIFSKSLDLWLVFLMQASISALIYLTYFHWPIFLEKALPSLNLTTHMRAVLALRDRDSEQVALWIIAVLGSTVPALVGNRLIMRWLGRPRAVNAAMGDGPVIGLLSVNVTLNVLLSAPIFAIAWIFYGRVDADGSRVICAAMLLAIQKVFEGASGPTRRALQNDLIPSGTPERATILSFGEGLSKLVVMALMLESVGQDPAVIQQWWIPAVAVLVTTAALFARLRPTLSVNTGTGVAR